MSVNASPFPPVDGLEAGDPAAGDLAGRELAGAGLATRQLLGHGRLGQTWTAAGPGGEWLVLKRLAGLGPAAGEAAELLHRFAAVPSCATPIGMEERDGDLWIAYSFVEGRTAVEAAAEMGPTVGADLQRAVAELHAAGLVHGALSDANVRVTDAGEIRLLDAGLATIGALGAVWAGSQARDKRDLAALLQNMATAGGERAAAPISPARSRSGGGRTARLVVAVAAGGGLIGPMVLVAHSDVHARGSRGNVTAATSVQMHPLPTSAPDCVDMSLPDIGEATYYAVDINGTGCAEPMAWRAGVISTFSEEGTPLRFDLGKPGDVLLVGRWSCSRLELPALYRPSTGQLFYLRAWPSGGSVVTSQPAVDTGVRNGEARTEGSSGCQRVVVSP